MGSACRACRRVRWVEFSRAGCWCRGADITLPSCRQQSPVCHTRSAGNPCYPASRPQVDPEYRIGTAAGSPCQRPPTCGAAASGALPTQSGRNRSMQRMRLRPSLPGAFQCAPSTQFSRRVHTLSRLPSVPRQLCTAMRKSIQMRDRLDAQKSPHGVRPLRLHPTLLCRARRLVRTVHQPHTSMRRASLAEQADGFLVRLVALTKESYSSRTPFNVHAPRCFVGTRVLSCHNRCCHM